MRYMGSKRRIAKHILPIILKNRKEGQYYVEPFVGGANSFSLVANPKVGTDSNPYVIQALKLIQNSPEKLPKKADDIPIDFYQQLKKDYMHELHGYVGFACSFGGKYYGGRIKAKYPGDDKNHQVDRVTSQYREAQKTSVGLQGAEIYRCLYSDLYLPPRSIVYCDPPYANTHQYNKEKFDSVMFWEWCRNKVKEGHSVFISEYTAPEDFVSVWERKSRTTLGINNNRECVEKLFIHRSQL